MKNKAITHLLSMSLVLAAALLPAQQAVAQRTAAAEFGLGLAAATANMIYGPVKVLYAVGGTLVGSLAWAITGGRRDVARIIMQPALRGDYALVPENLTMEKPYSFVGRDPEWESYPAPR